MKHFVMRRFVTVLCASGIFGISSQAMASAFQLWEQDGASVGNYHAGYAAEANDASTAWYNPAGITRFQNQQIVFGGSAIMSDFKYKGNVSVTENSLFLIPTPPFTRISPTTYTFNNVTAQGGEFSIVPALHYVTPLTERLGFGFSVDVPFGLKTNYGKSTPLRYAATMTSITVIDISPSLGFKVTDKASIGAGFDIQRAYAEFDSVAGLINPSPFAAKTIDPASDTISTNKANDTGYGYHLGALYEFTPNTRAGISYHSQVVHHFTGNSRFEGKIAALVNNHVSPLISGNAYTNVKLPAYTALSIFHKLNPNWALLGSAIYTQWSSFNTLNLNGVAGAVNNPNTIIASSTDIQVTIPEHYRNTWNISLGANYYPTDTIIVRGGVGYDQSPIQDAYRNVQLPDNDRYVVAVGGHFQATKTVGLDLGWVHVFIRDANVNPPALVTGAESVSTNGSVSGGADVFSGQVTWDIA
jgi:long-chain fatty acid transport protein